MRVVIVGATGNVGTSLTRTLAGDDGISSIVGLARRLPDLRIDKTRWARVDLTSDDLVPHLRDADAVVHLAWLFQPTREPHQTWRTNVLGSKRLFRAVVEAKVPALVYASSVGAYSPGPKDDQVDEQWPTDGWPTAGYTREKAYVERLLDTLVHEQPNLRVVRMRPGFIFKKESAVQQRRLFAGPLVPHALGRPGLVPVLPEIPGMRFQALHAQDAADAYRLAVTRPVQGAFNLAADPVVDMHTLASLLGARTVALPAWPARGLVAAAWHLRLTPASPHLFDAVRRMPIMSTARARTELGWTPRHSSLEAITEFLEGFRERTGLDTPPLSPRTSGALRGRELRTGVGSRD